jgi:hypothetical protein
MLRIPHFLDSWLIDGGKVVCPTHQPHFASQKHYYTNNKSFFYTVDCLNMENTLCNIDSEWFVLRGSLVTTAWRVLGFWWRNGLQLWTVVTNMLNKQSRVTKNVVLQTVLGVGWELRIVKNNLAPTHYKGRRAWAVSLYLVGVQEVR